MAPLGSPGSPASGSAIVDGPNKAPKDAPLLPANSSNKSADGLTAFGTDRTKLMQTLRSKGILPADNVSDPAKNIFESQTGEMLMDGTRGLLQFDTERTAGGYADPGVNIESKKGGVTISDLSIGATVFVTSVDGNPIKSSQRLLVTHLTDLQNTGITYAEPSLQTLLAWAACRTSCEQALPGSHRRRGTFIAHRLRPCLQR